jgi:phosphoribosylformylglycinamidine synthase subunit PurSL
MVMHVIEVSLKSYLPDARGLGVAKDILDLGIKTVTSVSVADIYWLDADLAQDRLETIGRDLLADPVTQEYSCYTYASNGRIKKPVLNDLHSIEVTNHAGVTDPTEESILKAIRDLGINVRAVKTVKRFTIHGKLKQKELDLIINRLLINPVVQYVVTEERFGFFNPPQYKFQLNRIPLLSANKEQLSKFRNQFGFSENEFNAIYNYFKQQDRDPTDAELETLAQTWSEHCVHKTFKGSIKFCDNVIENLLKTYIIKATEELAKPWCLSVFEDNAGVIDFDGRWALCFKVETHNHPSAVEPYGGAATGIGGVIRDPLGTGLGAKPILNTDVFAFAPPDFPHDKVPKGVLHPRRIFKGVRAGVADYGNRIGIPTLNGAVLFDERFIGNPLVFCGTLGIMPIDMVKRGRQQPGDLVVVVGGKTGRDGIHGVTFASVQLTDESGTHSLSSVQVGNPIVEKKVIDVLLKARDRRLYRRITDCGGGGLSSAIGEMGEETGVRVDLEKVPLKYPGLTYSEIWISESQERMLLAVPPENIKELLELFASENVETSVIGEFTGNRRLRLYYEGNLVTDIEENFLHKGLPKLHLEGVWEPPKSKEAELPAPRDIGTVLHKVLGTWNVCSKEWVIRQYDHEVQGGNVIKPMVGINNDGPSDAAIIRPLLDTDRGVIIANGICPRYGDIDPYWMAASAIDESLRQIIAVGGNLKRVALLDNFCWGSANRPEIIGALVKATKACYDMALGFGTPFISGKDSLNNEFEYEGKIISIPHTLLVSSISVMDDVNKAITMDFKKPGDLIYMVGSTYNELGGSEYFRLNGLTGKIVPKVQVTQAKQTMENLSIATEKGLVKACHDCSDGGMGVSLAEMAFAGGLGAAVSLNRMPFGESMVRDDFVLFSESNSRFLVEIAPENGPAFENIMKGIPATIIGKVTDSVTLDVAGLNGQAILSEPINKLKESWQKPLKW